MSTREPLRLWVPKMKTRSTIWPEMQEAYNDAPEIGPLWELEYYLKYKPKNPDLWHGRLNFAREYIVKGGPKGKYAPPNQYGSFLIRDIKLTAFRISVYDPIWKERKTIDLTENAIPEKYKDLAIAPPREYVLSKEAALNHATDLLVWWLEYIYHEPQVEIWNEHQWDLHKQRLYKEFLHKIVSYVATKKDPCLEPLYRISRFNHPIGTAHKQLAEHYLREWEGANNGQGLFEKDYKPTVEQIAMALRDLKDQKQLPENLKDLSNAKLAKKVSSKLNCSCEYLRQKMSERFVKPNENALAWVKAQLEIK